MRFELERLVRAGWPVVAGLVLGLVAGGIWTLAQPERHRAEARVQVRGAAEGVVLAVEALAGSSLLEQNVAQTLRLDEPPDVKADAGEAGIVTLEVEAGSSERARQIDAEAIQVLTQLVAARFPDTPVQVTVLDPAHPVEQTSPTTGRNLLVGGLIGLAAGAAAAAARARRRPLTMVAGEVDPQLERRLRMRIDEVARRERALARRAGELAKRERQVERREAETQRLEVAHAREPQPVPEPPPPPEPEVPAVAPAVGATVSRNVNDLQRAVAARTDASPEQAEEWRTYLFFLREHAASDGSLPPQFDSLIDDVFGELAQRSAE